MRVGRFPTIVLLAIAGLTSPAQAQPLPPSAPPFAQLPADSPLLGTPDAVVGEPVTPTPAPPPILTAWPGSTVPPTTAGTKNPSRRTTRAAGLGVPVAPGQVVAAGGAVIPAARAEAPVRQAGATDTPPPVDPVSDFLSRRSGYKDSSTGKDNIKPRSSWKFGERFDEILGERTGEWFRSDHAFDTRVISPVTSPFLFEDPRSLTEVRLLYLTQRIPGSQPDFRGGYLSFFGLQGRVAVTDRLSFVVNKLGGVTLDPGGDSIYSNATGFAELWFGPKYTFIRDEQNGTLLAGGLQFQAPIGSGSVFQDTHGVSFVPYATYSQSFLRDSRIGGMNAMANGGYAFSSSSRSDYLFLNGHVDLDVLNWHHIYPLAELNYVLYTTNGTAYPIGTEGLDLINFGGQARGQGLLSGAFGARAKITENFQFGGAFQAPIAGPRELMGYRFTLDFIVRY